MTVAAESDPLGWLEAGLAAGALASRGFDLTAPSPGSRPDPDPFFVAVLWWLKSEAGPQTVLASSDQISSLITSLSGHGPNNDSVADVASFYFESVGYPATEAGANAAVTDLFTWRIADGLVHPLIGVRALQWFGLKYLLDLKLEEVEDHWGDNDTQLRLAQTITQWCARRPVRIPERRLPA